MPALSTPWTAFRPSTHAARATLASHSRGGREPARELVAEYTSNYVADLLNYRLRGFTDEERQAVLSNILRLCNAAIPDAQDAA